MQILQIPMDIGARAGTIQMALLKENKNNYRTCQIRLACHDQKV